MAGLVHFGFYGVYSGFGVWTGNWVAWILVIEGAKKCSKVVEMTRFLH